MNSGMTSLMAIIACIVSSQALANSYVGNGGSQGDVELLVTLNQIKETFQVIEEKGKQQKNLCQCNEVFEGRSVCEPLKNLDESQAQFCHDSLNSQAAQILRLIDHRDEINIRWTNSPIDVEEAGKPRAADAVASRSRKEIVIQKQTFLEMKQPERVLLLTHELFHFTDLNGQPLTDVGDVGPLKVNRVHGISSTRWRQPRAFR